MGRNHLRVLSDLDGAELVAVCDKDAAAVDTVSRKHSIPGYTSWDEMLDRERLDAAIVVVPTRFHVDAGVAALERGLHVLVEKPIASNLEEGRRLVAAAAAALCLYDMTKSLDPTGAIESIVLLRKSGGKSGVWKRPA